MRTIMADFCKACSIEHFGKDFGDMAGLIKEARVAKGYGAYVICEGCGFILVDHEGRCISDDCSCKGKPGHGEKTCPPQNSAYTRKAATVDITRIVGEAIKRGTPLTLREFREIGMFCAGVIATCEVFDKEPMRKFAPLPVGHHAVGQLFCPQCGLCFEAGDVTTLMTIAPADEEEAKLDVIGRAHTRIASLVHWDCIPKVLRDEPE